MRKNIIVLIIKIIMMVVLVTITVDRITTTTMTNIGGFHFFECLEHKGTVLNILYTLSHCKQSFEEDVLLILWFIKIEVQRS